MQKPLFAAVAHEIEATNANTLQPPDAELASAATRTLAQNRAIGVQDAWRCLIHPQMPDVIAIKLAVEHVQFLLIKLKFTFNLIWPDWPSGKDILQARIW